MEIRYSIGYGLYTSVENAVDTEYRTDYSEPDSLSNFVNVVLSGIHDLQNRHSEADFFEKSKGRAFPIDKINTLKKEVAKLQ